VTARAAAAWDAEYAAGRYAGEPPVAFVRDIVAAARERGLRHGLYVGCGNGRNLLPLLDAGLDLTGLDISPQAIAQLQARRPDRASRLITGDLAALPRMARFDLVVGIQVFQHGTRAQAHQHLAAAATRVRPGACSASGSTRPAQTSSTRTGVSRSTGTAASPSGTGPGPRPGWTSISSPAPN
jgi:2-polyprenyl-3-methyl-5-hydroxy-6-metoxy-1,4-benzoquinol methylase